MINLSKVAYPEVKRVIDVGRCHDYLIGAGRGTATVRSLRTEHINTCTAGVLTNGKNHFMFHTAPELQPVASIKREIEKQVNVLRETCDNIKGFICGGLELNNRDSESVASFNLYNTIADTLDELGVNFTMMCGKKKGAPMENMYAVGDTVTVWSDAFKKIFPNGAKDLSQEEVIEALENHYQFVEQTDEHAFNVLEDFTPKVKHLVK